MAANNGLEIERRLLLKRLPYNFESQGWIEINQYYTPSGRLRQEHIYDKNGKLQEIRFIKQVKKSTETPGVNEESPEEILTEDQFDEFLKTATRRLNKTRYIAMDGKRKWEIDVFPFKLVIAEIEVETVEELKTVPIPKYIQAELIQDITGNKNFSNFNLSEKY